MWLYITNRLSLYTASSTLCFIVKRSIHYKDSFYFNSLKVYIHNEDVDISYY